MDLFKAIAIFIGWITSSFAGIAAILYAFGYLVSRAQLRSLGLFGLFELGPDYYLQEGANFFVVLVSIAIGPIIPWLVYAGLILLFLLIVSLPITIYLYKNGERIAKFFKKARNGAKIIIEKQQRLWREVVILVLFFFLIFHLANYINEFTPALEISNLLYGRTEDPPHNELIRCILSAERGCLEKHFLVLLRGTLEAGLALALAWHVASPWRLRTWLLAPFIVIFMLYLLFLPIAYGVLVRPSRFPVITISQKNGAVWNVKGNLFLLNKTERDFILWDQVARRILWIPSDQIQGAEVKEIRSLFEKTDVPRRQRDNFRQK